MKHSSKTFKIRGHTWRVKTKAAKTVNYLDWHKDYTTQNPLGVDDIAQFFSRRKEAFLGASESSVRKERKLQLVKVFLMHISIVIVLL